MLMQLAGCKHMQHNHCALHLCRTPSRATSTVTCTDCLQHTLHKAEPERLKDVGSACAILLQTARLHS